MIEATVVIPTYDHGPLLARSVASVQRQSLEAFELLIIGDGATRETVELARRLAADDPRIRFLEHEKSPRTGERYRHEALQTARGRFVAYLSDDDLWLPHHLESLSEALDGADLAHGFLAQVRRSGALVPIVADLAEPYYLARQRDERKPTNYMPLSSVGHRLDAYRRLPHGWRSTPPGIPTDLYMWRQWLGQPGLRIASSQRFSVLSFPDADWRPLPVAERDAELARWLARSADAEGIRALQDLLIADLRRQIVARQSRRPRFGRRLARRLGLA